MEYSAVFLWFSIVWTFLHLLVSARRWYFPTHPPPGPFTLPIAGNIFSLGKKPHESLAKLANTHGSLMTIKLGSLTSVVVSSASMAKEVLQKNDQTFSGRTVPDALRILNHPQASLAWLAPGLQWRNLRKLCATQMFTAQRLNANEEIRLMKVNDLIEYIRGYSKSGRAINIGQVMFTTTLNLISKTMFSIDLTDLGSSESAQDFKNIVWGVVQEVGRPNLADYFPFLRPFDLQGVRRHVTSYFEKLDIIFGNIIDQKLQSKDQNVTNDLLDALLHHPEERGFKLHRRDISPLLKDLFIAGIDTTSSTLEWIMTELLRNREILVKARSELKENIEKDKRIEESDIVRLPYLQAIVKETLRLHPPIPLLLPHRAETDAKVCGFDVPRHAQVLVNAWAIGRDSETWVNPNSFTPERFLGSEIDYRGQDFEFIPFGAGRRMCPGLPLAYRIIHLMLASLLQSFDWELADGMKPEDINMEENCGLTLAKAQPLLVVPIEA